MLSPKNLTPWAGFKPGSFVLLADSMTTVPRHRAIWLFGRNLDQREISDRLYYVLNSKRVYFKHLSQLHFNRFENIQIDFFSENFSIFKVR
jgi:hypothetical protein